MNSIFNEPRPLHEQMQQAVIALQNNERAAIVLVTADDLFASPHSPYLLRDEIKAEIAERLFGQYTFYEFNAAKETELSIPRYCKTLRERPACLFAYGLETLKERDKQRYENVLQLLNQHREDIRYTNPAFVLLMSSDVQKDVQEYAPDLADLRTASILFKVPQGQDVPATRVGRMPVAEADAMRRELARFQKAVDQPGIAPALRRDFWQQQAQILQCRGRLSESEVLQVKAAALVSSLDSINDIERFYLDYLLDHCSNMNPRGIPQPVRADALPLEEVYVSLSMESETERFGVVERQECMTLLDIGHGMPVGGLADMIQARQPHIEKTDLPQVICKNRRAVLLGGPGAGKTTLLKFLATRFAAARLNGETVVCDSEGNQYGEPLLPVMIRAADYADAYRKNRNLTLQEFLPQAFDNAPLTRRDLARLFQNALSQGRAFLLLDGLDEVAYGEDRDAILKQIDRFLLETRKGNRLLVTSRIVGYNEAKLAAGFATYTLCDMEREQIEQFVRRWCAAVARLPTSGASREAIELRSKEESDAILLEIDGSDRVGRSAKNPLLLALLTLIHRDGVRLPQRRIELYAHAVKTLLRDWRLIQEGSDSPFVAENEALALLGLLACWLRENEPTGMISEAKALEKLHEFCAEARGLTPGNKDVQVGAADFLRRVREHAGLFVERAPGQYGFADQTFEEYFTAREMRSDSQLTAHRIASYRHKPRWEECLRLAIAYGRPEDAGPLLRAAILAEGPEAEQQRIKPSAYELLLQRDLLLAARCLADCEGIEPKLCAGIVARLIAIAIHRERIPRYKPLRKMVLALLPPLAGSETGAILTAALFAVLREGNDNEQQCAVEALKQIGPASPEVLAALLAAFKDNSWDIRYVVVEALGKIGQATPEVLTTLVIALKDRNWEVRYSAAEALGYLGQATPEVLIGLIAVLEDKGTSMQHAAAAALGRLGQATPEVFAVLLAALQNYDTFTRQAAAEALRQIVQESPQSPDALYAALEEEEWILRFYASVALRQTGPVSPEVLDFLLAALKDGKQVLRQNAAVAFGQREQASPEVLAALLAALKDDNDYVRRSAAQALKQIDQASPEASAFLYATIKKGDQDIGMRQCTALALGHLGQAPPEALTVLCAALEDKDWRVRFYAAAVLVQIDPTSPEALAYLLATLKEESWTLQYFAATTLGRLGKATPDILAALLATLEDQDWEVRNSAWQALWNLLQKEES